MCMECFQLEQAMQMKPVVAFFKLGCMMLAGGLESCQPACRVLCPYCAAHLWSLFVLFSEF